jgi:alpha-beta hydrolase superfamily lysophospholipase
MKKIVLSTASYALKCCLYGVVGATIMLLVVGIRAMNNKPDLQVWHVVELDEEFTEESAVTTFDEYVALEDRLFHQLDTEVYVEGDADSATSINRYTKQSLSDATSWGKNWNRSFELKAESPKSGVLLLHGLTDAPYSLLGIGKRLNAEGAYVVGLRIPGHGTVPSALTETTWQDMAAAVRIAMRHLKEQVGEQPLYVIGYSNGGALSVRYALESIEDTSLPALDGMALLSPEIGITATAAFAIWQERIGYVLGLDKLQWTSVLPEYDPYKYTSFPANAGMLAHNLTVANRVRIRELSEQGKLDSFPRVLAFQSLVDSTVLAPALVHDLLAHLPGDGHDLVIYDINRSAQIEALIVDGKVPDVAQLEKSAQRSYTLTLITNESPSSESVESRVYPPSVHEPEVESIDLKWPRTIYSLSHVALPFHEDNAIYGAGPRKDPTRIHLGAIAIRGEKGVLAISAADMLRQRWNPFYEYQEDRIVEHFKVK